jgi:NAD(P)-dependent dehydrogenase (short-subunit alcohol dehydrogenase family)
MRTVSPASGELAVVVGGQGVSEPARWDWRLRSRGSAAWDDAQVTDEVSVALVTGSASGIGEGIARRLAADGMRVLVHSRASREAGQRVADEVHGAYLQADLAEEQQARDLITHAVAVHGRLDVLVNNAGISWPIPHADLEAATPADWRRLLEVNLIAPWILTTAALPALRLSRRLGGGSIVNITSHAGVRPKGSSIPYAASKAALNHTTKLLAVALGPEVRVNAVAPGLVDTPMTKSWTAAQEMWRDRSPMRRAATPADVADVVAALVASTYLTGEVVLLDGGLNLL